MRKILLALPFIAASILSSCEKEITSPRIENRISMVNKEDITTFVSDYYSNQEYFPSVDSVKINNEDVSVYAGFWDDWVENAIWNSETVRNQMGKGYIALPKFPDSVKVVGNNMIGTYRYIDHMDVEHSDSVIIPKIDHINVDVEPFNFDYKNPTYQIKYTTQRETNLRDRLNMFYALFSENQDGPDPYIADYNNGGRIFLEVADNLNK